MPRHSKARCPHNPRACVSCSIEMSTRQAQIHALNLASPPEGQRALRRIPAILLALSLIAWMGALFPGGFAFDDSQAILDNPYVRGDQPLLTAFSQDYWHHIGDAGHYRPLASLSLRIDHALFADWSPGYHLTAILLHGLVCFAAGLLAIRLAKTTREAYACLVGLAIFAIHPGLADAVAWISARSSTLSILPGLAIALGLHHLLKTATLSRFSRGAWIALSLGTALLLGLLGKEDGFLSALFPLLVVARLGGLREGRVGILRDGFACALGIVVGLAIYGYLRNVALGSPFPSAPHAPLASAPLGQRLHVAGAALVEAGRLLCAPTEVTPNFRAQDWSAISKPVAWLGWGMWLVCLGLGAYSLRHRLRLRSTEFAAPLALLLAPLAALPVLQIVPAGEIFAGRFLYVPLLLSAPALGAVAIHLSTKGWRHSRRTSLALGSTIVIAATISCWAAAKPYGSNVAYEEAVLRRFPSDPLAWNGLGLAREEQGDVAGARAAWRFAIDVDETYGRPHSNLGRLDLFEGNTQSALLHFQAAVKKGAGNPTAWSNLGAIHLRAKAFEKARSAYERATELAPGMSAAWAGLGRALLELESFEQAREALDRALRLDPLNTSALRNRGNTLLPAPTKRASEPGLE